MINAIELEPRRVVQRIYSVSELSNSIKTLVEVNFDKVRIRGEVQDCKVHSSGHVYFVLKDTDSVIDAVCWRGAHMKSPVKLESGLEIVCDCRVTTYPMRSKYQIVVNSYEVAGEGALLKLIEERKKRLYSKGVFANSRALPFLPKLVGVITSPTGAVIRDIMHRVRGRNDAVDVLLWPVLVQGAGASEQIIGAIEGMNALPQKPDVLIIARGGGSLEDLMPFNDENLAIAIYKSGIPIVSAVGHETDTSISDMAADLRAPTPTAAAELVVPVRADLKQKVIMLGGRIDSLANGIFVEKHLRAKALFKSFPPIGSYIALKKAALDMAFQHVSVAVNNVFNSAANSLAVISAKLVGCSYQDALKRGFAIVLDERGDVVKSVADVGRRVRIRVADGEIAADVVSRAKTMI